jgi:vitamin B12 transporter
MKNLKLIKRILSFLKAPRNIAEQFKHPTVSLSICFNIIIIFSLLSLLLPARIAFSESNNGRAKALSLGEVIVTAERIQEYLKNHPQEVSVVERKEIVERNLGNVEEVLKTMPGVEVYSTPGIGSRISIRGSGRASGIIVLVNGRPLNSNQYGSQDLSTIPIDSIQSISVFKPPVPVWLGSGGSNGVINIEIAPGTIKKGTNKSPSTVKTEIGSYGFIEGGLTHQFNFADGDALFSTTTSHRDGSRANSDRTSESMAVNWKRLTNSGESYEIGSRYYQAEYGSPGPMDNPTPNARQEYQKLSVDTKYSQALAKEGTLSATLYGDLLSLEDLSQSGLRSTLDDRKIGLKADTTWSRENFWDLRFGINSEWDEFDHTLAGDHHRFRNGLSSQYDHRFGELTPTIGLRSDLTNDFDFAPGFLAGVGWSVSKSLLLRLKGGYTVNIPTFEQLYQTSHGSIDQTRGNPNLEEEHVWSYDLGFEYTLSKDRLLQVTLFRADTSDLITSQRGTDLIYRPINIDRAVRQGIEITGKYSWKIGLASETSMTLQESENVETGKDLPYTPALKAKSTLRYILPEQKTRLEGTIRYEGCRYGQVENLPSQEIDDYVLVDLKITQPLKTFAADVYLKIDNLLDRSYETHLGYPADGIIITTGLQMKF